MIEEEEADDADSRNADDFDADDAEGFGYVHFSVALRAHFWNSLLSLASQPHKFSMM